MKSLHTKFFATKRLLCGALLLLLTGGIFFQTVQAQQHRVCGTDELSEATLQQSPEARKALEAAEKMYQEYLQNPEAHRTTGGIKTIPVIVHIIQASNIEMIDSAQVASQIEVLNELSVEQNEEAL